MIWPPQATGIFELKMPCCACPSDAMWSWGLNTYGNLALGDNTTRLSPVEITTPTNWKFVYASQSGNQYVFALKSDGTLWSCGYNAGGQLGLGDTTNRNVFVQIGTATNWQAMGVFDGFGSMFAIRADGTLWSWGNNSNGQLGLGDTTNRLAPVQVGTGTTWASVKNRGQITIAQKTDGSIWGCGYGGNGSLGQNNTTDQHSFVQLGTATNWASYDVNGDFYGIKTDNTLWVCGTNTSGQLGLGSGVIIKKVLTQVGSNVWQSIFASGDTIYAIKTDGTLWAWGSDGHARSGLGITGNIGNNLAIVYTPTQVGSSTLWLAMTGTSADSSVPSLGLRTDGTLWATGGNSSGQLGLGDTTDRITFVQVGVATDWTLPVIDPAGRNVLALKTGGTLWAWGNNLHGQLGISSTTDQHSPVQVGTGTWKFISLTAYASYGIQ